MRNKIQAAPVLRAHGWRRGVGQPLLRDDPVLRPQAPTRDAEPRLFKQGRQQSAAQDIDLGTAPREPIASAKPVRHARRRACAPGAAWPQGRWLAPFIFCCVFFGFVFDFLCFGNTPGRLRLGQSAPFSWRIFACPIATHKL